MGMSGLNSRGAGFAVKKSCSANEKDKKIFAMSTYSVKVTTLIFLKYYS